MAIFAKIKQKIKQKLTGAAIALGKARARSGKYDGAAYIALRSWAAKKLGEKFLQWKFPVNAWMNDPEFITKVVRDPATIRFVYARREFVSGLPYFFEGQKAKQILAFYEIFKHIPLYGKYAGRGLLWHSSEGIYTGTPFIRQYPGILKINGRRIWIPCKTIKQSDFRNWHLEHKSASDPIYEWKKVEYFTAPDGKPMRGQPRGLTEYEKEVWIIAGHNDVEDQDGFCLGVYESMYYAWRIVADCTAYEGETLETYKKPSLILSVDSKYSGKNTISPKTVKSVLDDFVKEFTAKKGGHVFGSNVPMKLDVIDLSGVAFAAMEQLRQAKIKEIGDVNLGSSHVMTGEGSGGDTKRASKTAKSILVSYTANDRYYLEDIMNYNVTPLIHKYNPALMYELEIENVEDLPKFRLGTETDAEEMRKNFAMMKTMGIDLSGLDAKAVMRSMNMGHLIKPEIELQFLGIKEPGQTGMTPPKPPPVMDGRAVETKGDTANPGTAQLDTPINDKELE